MSEPPRPRILIADDHTLIAEAFKRFLATDFDVIATVHDGHNLIQAANTLRPDVILADIAMPFLNGLHAAERIKRVLPEVKLIYVTINEDPSIIAEAFRLGASGYLLKTSVASELVRAIHCVLQGKPYLSPSLATSVTDLLSQLNEFQSSRYKLTDRQIEVLQLLAEGRSMKEAAAVLNLTTRTVAFHKYRIMDSLGLHNDAEVVQYAMREHIVFT
ncbi:MAG TPA: response regulator transcription factor [Edaphobacter sp.]|nr:response regulator transcription factor [Edaphobacter sp.]